MGIITPNSGDDKERNSEIGELTGNKKGEISEALVGNTKAILDDLKKNHVRIEENAEVMGYKGKKVHINLPAVGKFEGFKFDYFVSECGVHKRDFEKNPELEKKSYSMNDISKLLHAMNEYMAELQGKNDGDMNYEDELRSWEHKRKMYYCDAGYCLRIITGLDRGYWLSDNNMAGIKNSRAILDCDGGYSCYFRRSDPVDCIEALFLRLSD